ncbi:MAG TPA: tRNA 2-thiouridine(34) synthase MnmA [Longimicrobiales bacterium]
MSETVVVAMSGGVDSSLAAALLVEQGERVIGVTMKTFCYSGNVGPTRTCCGLEGIMDARRVADKLGIPHYVFDMEEAFTASVIDDFVSEYVSGRTPNPCVRCNSNTKIPDLLRRARGFGADTIATGHYARILRTDASTTPVALARALDLNKDQSYFLWGVPADVLPHLRFPVGELSKPEVRARARSLGLVTADKPESQEICFVPSGDYAQFLAGRVGAGHASLTPGRMITSSGDVVGEHTGYARYTVGQRKGLGGGRGRALYVLGVNASSNEVVVGGEDELFRNDVVIGDLNWLNEVPRVGEELRVQIRHRARAVRATVRSIDTATIALDLIEAQRAVTPGQSGVLYRDDIVVGGGRIR